MKVTSMGEYGEIISRYFQSGFPKSATTSKSQILDIVTDLLVGTKEYRQGPKPSVESLYTIRQTLAKAIEKGVSIPVVVPWGGRKMDKTLGLDVAEVSAIRQILQVDNVVRKVYAPGLKIRIRIEDLNAEWLYKEITGIKRYSYDLKTLVDLVKGEAQMIGVLETEMMDYGEYMQLSARYSDLLKTVLKVQTMSPNADIREISAFKELLSKGWKGEIPLEQREYYLKRYRKLYPELQEDDYITKLADYFGGSKARHDMKGLGAPTLEDGSYLQINFATPVPGAPRDMFSNTLYYRTIPESYGRTHIAPWRGKGYIEILDDNPIPKITCEKINGMYESEITIEGEDNSVNVRTDYTLATAVIPIAMMV
jgi:hypothetical protein